jgi:hypothetical protein
MNVCLSTSNTLAYPQGGHLWVFINWALALRACGCHVVWLDVISNDTPMQKAVSAYQTLRDALRPFALADSIAVDTLGEDEATIHLKNAGLPTLDELDPGELLLDLRYDLPHRLIKRYRRSALIDLDPGQLQLAILQGKYRAPEHDILFSVGEWVPEFQKSGREWLHTFPCVALEQWPVVRATPAAPWTTVSHWWGAWMMDHEGNLFPDAKKDGFRPYMELPSKVPARFELAVSLGGDEGERRWIEAHGFRVVDAHQLTSTPDDYRHYIQRSAGEFSCAKPSYVKLRTAWLSDRTVCYLASGKPCVVQRTGPSNALPPDAGGLYRFVNLDGAVACMKRVIADYPAQCEAARALAESHFAGKNVAARLLSTVLSE